MRDLHRRGGGQVLGGGLQSGGGTVGERLAVTETRDRGVEVSQPAKRCGCLGAADIEYAADDLPVCPGCAPRRLR